MPTELPEPTEETTRLTLHKLLDLSAAFDPESGTVSPVSYELVINELSQIGAVALRYDDTDRDGTMHVDASPLIGAVGFLGGLLVEYLAQERGVDRLAIVNTLRSVVDDAHPGTGRTSTS